MSMAVVNAQLSLFGLSFGVVKPKSYSNWNVASSSGGLVFRPRQYRRDWKACACLDCRASSGGSRRDYDKILARKQKRRVRHMKGVTPSTPDLIETLDSEKRDQAKLDLYPDAVNDEEGYDREENMDFEEEGIPLSLDKAAPLSPNIARASDVYGEHVAPVSEGNEGLGDVTAERSGVDADIAGVQEDPTADRV